MLRQGAKIIKDRYLKRAYLKVGSLSCEISDKIIENAFEGLKEDFEFPVEVERPDGLMAVVRGRYTIVIPEILFEKI